MSSSSDLHQYYQEWLEIPADRLPPNHYAILGVEDYESDTDVIERAAKSRGAYLHQLASGPERKTVQQLLSQVAVAKRTLLSDELRLAYDRELRSPSLSSDLNAASGQGKTVSDQSDSDPTSVEANDAATTTSSTPYRRRKPSQWPLHAASASVLLAIVGIVYWVNRDPGGRRAAEVSSQATQSMQAAEVASRSSAAGQNDGSATEPRKRLAPVQTTSADTLPRKSKSPIVARRETGSGLGTSLGSKFGNILDDIESQSSQVAEGMKSSDAGFQPMAGLLIGKAKKNVPVKLWPTEFVTIDSFPKAIEKRFEVDAEGIVFQATDHGIEFDVSGTDRRVEFADTIKLAVGNAFLIRTSLPKEQDAGCSVAVVIEGIQIGVRRSKDGVEIFARDRTEDSKRNSVSQFKTSAENVAFVVARDPKSVDRLRWMARIEEQIQAGTIDATSLSEEASVSLVIQPPTKDVSQPLKILELQTGRLGGKRK
ncbi:hypothetical protein [Roseiconus lacunae]|uniref:hypothetical protein n=1 Tax=Roseiconus lacunae TaxID=2605694 RepID=UPI001E3DECF9|nr:hypothetical protein [Roseiconus lacunae]MCD0459371.1 hypothetical protein [Roseiconus lacunae]